jgi:hypothetical protein
MAFTSHACWYWYSSGWLFSMTAPLLYRLKVNPMLELILPVNAYYRVHFYISLSMWWSSKMSRLQRTRMFSRHRARRWSRKCWTRVSNSLRKISVTYIRTYLHTYIPTQFLWIDKSLRNLPKSFSFMIMYTSSLVTLLVDRYYSIQGDECYVLIDVPVSHACEISLCALIKLIFMTWTRCRCLPFLRTKNSQTSPIRLTSRSAAIRRC